MANLDDMEREVKKLKELMELQSRLRDSQTRLGESTRKLSDHERKLVEALEQSVQVRKTHRDASYEMDAANRNITRSYAKSRSSAKKATEELAKLQQQYENARRTGKELADIESKRAKKLEEVRGYNNISKAQKELIENLSRIKSEIDAINTRPVEIRGLQELDRLARLRLEHQKNLIDAQRASGQFSRKEADRLKKQLDTTEALAEARADLAESRMSGPKRDVVESLNMDSIRNGGSIDVMNRELGRRYFDNQSSRLGNLRQVFGSRSGFRGRLEAMNNLQGNKAESEGIKGAMGMMGKEAKGLTGSFKALGGAMKALGKMGWIGLIIQAVVMLGKAINDLDKFVKGFNKSFMQMYGPINSLGDIGEETRRFTDSIFDVKRNLKYGTKSEDIMGLYGSLTGSGMSLGKLDGMADYNEIVEEASKLHLQLGTDMESVGTMIEKQMFNMMTSFDKAAKSLRVIGYDASKSGVNMQKFYEAALASAEGLAYYGNYLTKASNMLKNYQKISGMSHQEATKQTQEMMNYLDGLDVTGRAKVVSLAGEDYMRQLGQDFSSMAQKEAEAYGDELIKLRKRREAADSDEASILDKKIAELEEKRAGSMRKHLSVQNALESGNFGDLLSVTSYFSGSVEDIFGRIFKNVRSNGSGLDIFDSSLATEMFAQNLGLSKDAIQKYRERALMGLHNAKDYIGKYGNAFQGDSKTRDTMSGAMDAFTQTGDVEALRRAANQNLDAVNSAFGSVEDFLRVAEEAPLIMQKILDGSAVGMTEEQLKNFTLESTGKAVEIAQKFEGKKMDDAVKYTHSIEDFLGITEEAAKYFAGRNVPEATKYAMYAVEKLSTIVTLLEHISKLFGRKSDEEFKKSDEYTALQKSMYELELLKRVEKEGSLSKEQGERKEELERIVDRLSEGRNKVVSELTQEIYKKLESKSDFSYKGRYGQDALAGARKDTDKSLLSKKISDTLSFASNVLYATPLAGAKAGWEIAKGIAARTTEKKVENDYVAMSDGLVRLAKGDVVVNAKGISDGVGGEKGQFLSKAINKLSQSGGGSTGGSVTIPVNVSIGSVNGDAQEIVTKLEPVMRQTFERLYFEKQKRGN